VRAYRETLEYKQKQQLALFAHSITPCTCNVLAVHVTRLLKFRESDWSRLNEWNANYWCIRCAQPVGTRRRRTAQKSQMSGIEMRLKPPSLVDVVCRLCIMYNVSPYLAGDGGMGTGVTGHSHSVN